MIKTFVFLALILASFSAFSQSDVVITLKGDTLKGKTSITSNRGSAIQTIILKNEKDKMKFKAYEIKFLLKGGEVYHTLKINGKYQLGLLIKDGYLSIYKVMGSESTASNEFSYAVLVKKGGSQLKVPNIGFKKYVSHFLNDCATVIKGFENDMYKKSDLEKIVDDYNGCINKNTRAIHNKTTTVSFDPYKVEQIEGLIKIIKEDGSLPELDSVLEMLNDLKSKIKGGTKVPSYLKNALRTSLKVNETYAKQLNQILE